MWRCTKATMSAFTLFNPRRPLSRRRYERPAGLSLSLLPSVMELVQVSEHRRCRWYTALTPDPPPLLHRLTLATAHPMSLHPSQQTPQTLVTLQPVQIGHRFPSRHIQQHQRRDHLDVSPALAHPLDPHVTTHRFPQTRRGHHVQIDPGSRHCRHTGRASLRSVLEWQNSLRHNGCTSLVMALSLQQTILARFTAGSNEVFLLLRWGIWDANPDPPPKPESTEGRPWGQPLKKAEGAPLNLG